jgi:mannose-1-phosphate guanylyltransferase
MTSMPDAIILCGGAGLRLKSVTGDAPKSMARIAGRPFLELLLKQLRRHGFQRVVMAVGYQMEVIRSHFGRRAFGLFLQYSEEPSPLGTGGALRNAVDLVDSDCALIMNGDSYTDADLYRFSLDHRAAKADVSLTVVPADRRNDCGLVSLAQDGMVLGFKEKQTSAGPQYFNAGIYLAARSLLHEIPAGRKISLEEELFPKWLADGKRVRGFIVPGACIDIGTPERFQSAQDILANAELDKAAS